MKKEWPRKQMRTNEAMPIILDGQISFEWTWSFILWKGASCYIHAMLVSLTRSASFETPYSKQSLQLEIEEKYLSVLVE